jgi:hypothetical protein
MTYTNFIPLQKKWVGGKGNREPETGKESNSKRESRSRKMNAAIFPDVLQQHPGAAPSSSAAQDVHRLLWSAKVHRTF